VSAVDGSAKARAVVVRPTSLVTRTSLPGDPDDDQARYTEAVLGNGDDPDAGWLSCHETPCGW
jgi:hypothetical protein